MDNAIGALGSMVCVLLIAIPIGLLIGAVILRAACALYNKIAGASPPGRKERFPYNPYDEEQPATAAGSSGIQERPGQGYGGIQERPDKDYGDFQEPDRDLGIRRAVGVPEPELLKAMGIVLAIGVANFVANFCIGLALGGAAAPLGQLGGGRGVDPMAALLANLVTIPIDFLIQAALLSAMLPTSFGKAALVSLIQILIVMAIGAVLVLAFLGAMAIGFRM
jgi:hypothetical protein